MTDRISYLFDPLCGWCYGASPMLEKLRAEGVQIEAVPTGLFSGAGARPLDSGFAAYAWANDQRIERLTGQMFSEAYRQNVLNGSTVFDSGSTTLGIVAAGMTDPELRFDALRSLQNARYVGGLDTADKGVVAGVLHKAGHDEAADRVLNPDEALLEAVRDTVAHGQRLFNRLGANGVPALAFDRDGELHLLDSSALFGSIQNLRAHLQAA